MSRVYFGFLTMEAGAAAVTLLTALTRELRVLNAWRCFQPFPGKKDGAGPAQSKARPWAFKVLCPPLSESRAATPQPPGMAGLRPHGQQARKPNTSHNTRR